MEFQVFQMPVHCSKLQVLICVRAVMDFVLWVVGIDYMCVGSKQAPWSEYYKKYKKENKTIKRQKTEE